MVVLSDVLRIRVIFFPLYFASGIPFFLPEYVLRIITLSISRVWLSRGTIDVTSRHPLNEHWYNTMWYVVGMVNLNFYTLICKTTRENHNAVLFKYYLVTKNINHIFSIPLACHIQFSVILCINSNCKIWISL